jgi:hypothetical protein
LKLYDEKLITDLKVLKQALPTLALDLLILNNLFNNLFNSLYNSLYNKNQTTLLADGDLNAKRYYSYV